MKSSAFALILFFASISVSQAQQRQLNGFLEIPWGTPPDQARTMLEAKTQATYDSGKSTSDKPWWHGGTFVGQPVAFFALDFTDKKLSGAFVFIKPASPGHKEEYKAFKKLLTEKYNAPTTEHTKGGHWKAEWKCSVAGSKESAAITLENAPEAQGCKITYTLHRVMPAAGLPAKPAGKKDL